MLAPFVFVSFRIRRREERSLHSLVHSFIRSVREERSLRSFVHSFIRSFVHSVHSLARADTQTCRSNTVISHSEGMPGGSRFTVLSVLGVAVSPSLSGIGASPSPNVASEADTISNAAPSNAAYPGHVGGATSNAGMARLGTAQQGSAISLKAAPAPAPKSNFRRFSRPEPRARARFSRPGSGSMHERQGLRLPLSGGGVQSGSLAVHTHT